MKRTKRGWKSLVSLCLSLGIVTSMFFGVAYPKLPETTGYISTVEAAGSVKVIKADKSTAAKVHKQLYRGKAVTLKVKGGQSSSQKLLKKLMPKVQKANKNGVIFHYNYINTKGNYSYYTVSSDDAQLYMYSVKFVNKLWKTIKTKLNTDLNKALYQDYLRNKNEQSRMLHTAYDFYTRYLVATNYAESDGVCYSNQKIGDAIDAVGGWNLKKIVYSGTSPQTTVASEILMRNYSGMMQNGEIYDRIIKSIKTVDGEMRVQVMSYKEFASNKKVKKLYGDENTWCSMYYKPSKGSTTYFKGANHLFLRNREAILYKTKNFCDLSAAMKVYAIGYSDYFSCQFSHSNISYSMIYDSNIYYPPAQTGKAMKNLYKNKAKGVCQAFAAYERILFDQLNITNYFNSNFNINHAWSVVKVKNSKGKTLWIPFDYGIGPCDSRGIRLAVSDDIWKKYLSTDKKRYKLYLANIPGAPTKKNFTNADFN